MRKFIIASLMAASALPAAASAQSWRELRHDRQDIRQEQRDVNRARRQGDWRDVRGEQRELRGARQEYREDIQDRNRRWARNDWQRWRERNRAIYARGNWNAPFRYNAFNAGVRLQNYYYEPRYYVNDPWRYRLPPIYRSQRWVRHYNDLLLVDIRTGYIVRVLRNFYW